MAKIVLNVELNAKEAQAGLRELKNSLKIIADSLKNVQPNKDLTEQVKALSEYYKSLATAAKSAVDADSKAAISAAKVTKAEQDAAKATAQRQKAETDAAAALARRSAAEARAFDTIEKTKAAMEKRAKAAEGDEKALWNLEKAFASLSKRQEEAASKTNAMDQALRDVAEETEETWKEIRAFNENGEALSSTVDELRERYERLAAQTASYEKELNEQVKAEIEAKKEAQRLADSFQKSEENLDGLTLKLNNMLTAISNVEGRYPAGTFDQLKADIQAQIAAVDGLKESVSSSGGNMQEFIEKEQAAEQSTRNLNGRFAELKASTEHAAPAVATLGEKFGNLVERYAKFYASSLLVRKPLQLIQSALSDVGETLVKTEDAVIELNRVLDDPQPTQEVANRLYDIAYAYGSTFESASTIASNFARAGKSWNESLQATEAALLAMNVAELNATEASDGLLSIIAQFDMETSDLIDVVDKLNKTADKNPVSTQKLLQAIQRAGSAAKNANVSFDQTLGLITAISEATNRSGQNIGTAVNSLIQYSTKNVDVFATLSKESEEMVEKFKLGLVSIVDVWNQVAKDIHDDKEARDNIITALGTDDLEELSSTLHDELGDLVSEIDNTYNVANTYRKNYFIALLDNMDRYMKVQEQLTDYQGYSQEENEKYMETYTAKVNQLNDAWQKLANDEQGILSIKKSLVEMGIGLVGFIEKSGGIVNSIGTIAGIVIPLIAAIKSADIVNGVVKLYEGIQKLRADLPDILGHLGDIGVRLDEWRAATDAVRAATEAQASATELAELAEYQAAAGAAVWQAAMGWIAAAVTVISLLVSGINAYNAAQERARQEAISLGKETADTAKKIGELRAEMVKLNPESKEYRDTEEKIVELLGDKQILLDGLIKGTEDYTKKVKELTDAELVEAQYNGLMAKQAAETNVKSALRGYTGGMSAMTDIGSALANADTFEKQYEVYQRFYDRLKQLKKDYLVADAQGDAETKKRLEDQIKYYQQFVDKTGTAFEEWKTAAENNAALARLALDQSVEGISAAMLKVPAAARMSQEELQAIADENGMTLEEVREAYSKVGQGVSESLDEIEEKVRDVSDMTEEELAEAAEKAAGSIGAVKEAADAIKAVTEAQEEFAETGTLSIATVEKLAKLSPELVATIFDETGAFNLNSEALSELIGKYQGIVDESGYLVETGDDVASVTEKITDNIKDLSAQIDDVQSALSLLNDVQAEYDEYGSLSIDTLQKLIEMGSEYLELIIDEEGQIRLNEEAVDALTQAKNDLLDELIAQQVEEYALNKLHEYMAKSTDEMGDAAQTAAQKVELAALALAHFEGNEEGAKRAAEDFEEALHRLALSEGAYFEDWEEDWVKDVVNFRSGLTSLYSNTDTSRSGWERSSGASASSSSSSGSVKDEELERLKDVVSLRESELTLMEHQGASEEEQIAKIREIQAGIHDVAEHLRATNASQEDINKEMSEWWKWEEKINKFAEDRQKAAEKEAEEAEKARKKAEEDAKKAAEEAEKARIAALNAETTLRKQNVADLKAELNLWQKQGKSISDQVEKMKKIQDGLHEEAEWLRFIQATEEDIKVTQADIDALSAEWWDWQEKILKLYKETLEAARDIELEAQQKVIDGILAEIKAEEEALELSEKRLAIDEKRADLEDAIAKAKLDYVQSVLSDYITALDDAETLESKQRAVAEAREKLVTAEREARSKAIIDAFKAEREVKSDTLSLDEKRLAVEQARQALIDAENNRTTRVYNEATGQWEYQADAKAVQSAKDNLTKAVDALNAYVEEQAWNEVAEAVENGSVSEAEVLEILSKWAKEAYGNGSPEFVQKIQSAFRKAMGTAASPDSVSGQISAVDNAVKSLNDYLKAEAVKELKAYIAAGNTDAAGMKSILDKWLSMGEGAELYQWRDGLLDSVNGAIESGYYDDSKVQSQIQAVENAVDSLHEYLRNRFIREIEDLVKNGTAEEIRAAIEKWSEMEDFDLAPSDLDWATRAADAVEQKENTQSMWDAVMAGDKSSGTINWVLARMKQNSAAWWDADKAGDSAEKKRLSDENYTLGTMMGWHRKDNGHWYDEYDRQVYDKGGVLHGKGGIKATNKPEIILDPELTAKILRPGSEAQFRAFADAMHLMFERGGRTRAELPVIRNPSVTDSHNTSYTVNGIPISSGSAERYTISELFRMLPMARS